MQRGLSSTKNFPSSDFQNKYQEWLSIQTTAGTWKFCSKIVFNSINKFFSVQVKLPGNPA